MDYYVLFADDLKTSEFKIGDFKQAKNIGTNQFFVHTDMFKYFEKGKKTSFILSANNEIIAYYRDNNYQLLTRTKQLINKEEMTISVSIPQKDQIINKQFDFELMDEL